MVNRILYEIIERILMKTSPEKTIIFDNLIHKTIKYKHDKRKKNINVELPINLMNKYKKSTNSDKEYIKKIVKKLIEYEFSEERWLTCLPFYNGLLESIGKKIKYFSDKPYQLGGLDLEIEVIVMIISQINEPRVLEIGVANGYSSACLYSALRQVGGSIISIDYPRFSDGLGDFGKIREYLVKRGFIKNTTTLGDINPGGIVPTDKYAGWLVPFELREQVVNINLFGNVFNILPEIRNSSLNVVVYDAMKPYDLRMKCFEIINNKLSMGGFCFVDGYWVNSAFIDFCKKKKYIFETFGRVGVFKKSISKYPGPKDQALS